MCVCLAQPWATYARCHHRNFAINNILSIIDCPSRYFPRIVENQLACLIPFGLEMLLCWVVSIAHTGLDLVLFSAIHSEVTLCCTMVDATTSPMHGLVQTHGRVFRDIRFSIIDCCSHGSSWSLKGDWWCCCRLFHSRLFHYRRFAIGLGFIRIRICDFRCSFGCQEVGDS
jgi:hypothetical protein